MLPVSFHLFFADIYKPISGNHLGLMLAFEF